MTIVLQDVLKDKRRIAMGGHVRPDGDCVGSCMGLYLYLKEQFPQIHTDVYLEEVPEAYRMISGTDALNTQIPEEGTYQLIICLDFRYVKKLDSSAPQIAKAGETLCIAHHISINDFTDLHHHTHCRRVSTRVITPMTL